MSSLERANSSNKLPAKGFDSDVWEELAEWSAEAFRAALVAKASQGVKFKFYVLRGAPKRVCSPGNAIASVA